jgi:hypothetical protein
MLEYVSSLESFGTCLKFKVDQKIFSMYTEETNQQIRKSS